MIKILIVEDNPIKSRAIVRAICKNESISDDFIELVDNTKDAKRRLSEFAYDLLILDMNLPRNLGGDPCKSEGLSILNYIKVNNRAIQPRFVVGLTQYPDEFKNAVQSFNSVIFQLFHFDENDEWQEPLINAITYLVDKDHPPYTNDGHTYHCDIAILCALDEELESVLQLYEGWETVKIVGDSTTYKKIVVSGGSGNVSLVVAACPKMGLSFASSMATKMIMTFRPKFLAMTGICAGVRGKTNYGDILVADPIFDWGGGKWVASPDDASLKFRPAPYPWRLDEDIREFFKELSSAGNLKLISEKFSGNKPAQNLALYIDAMASGGSVLQANSLMEDVREQHKNLIGIEMESYGVFTAAMCVSKPRPTCFSIKSVCDFGDESKNDDYHHYASFTSANFLRLVIENLDKINS